MAPVHVHTTFLAVAFAVACIANVRVVSAQTPDCHQWPHTCPGTLPTKMKQTWLMNLSTIIMPCMCNVMHSACLLNPQHLALFLERLTGSFMTHVATCTCVRAETPLTAARCGRMYVRACARPAGNNTGYTDPQSTLGWGVVDFDWSVYPSLASVKMSTKCKMQRNCDLRVGESPAPTVM